MAKPDPARQSSAQRPNRRATRRQESIMKTLGQSLKIIALAIGVLTMSACASLDVGSSSPMPAAKMDNGLGELPHYRDCVDPSGRTPTQAVLTASDSTR
jgi:hypothetical protein